MDESYAEVGTWVILGRHKRSVRGFGTYWDSRMNQYVGRKTKIKHVCAFDDKIVLCQVACDNGHFLWRAEDMILASDVPLLTTEQKAKLGIRGTRKHG
jgi:hypothetical protein